jgi:hypothetical protein
MAERDNTKAANAVIAQQKINHPDWDQCMTNQGPKEIADDLHRATKASVDAANKLYTECLEVRSLNAMLRSPDYLNAAAQADKTGSKADLDRLDAVAGPIGDEAAKILLKAIDSFDKKYKKKDTTAVENDGKCHIQLDASGLNVTMFGPPVCTETDFGKST